MGREPDNFDTFFSPGGNDPPPRIPPAPKSPTERPTGEDFETQDFPETKIEEGEHEPSPPPESPSTRGIGSSSEVERVGAELVQLEIITKDEWQSAIEQATHDADLPGVLKWLQRVESSRRSRTEPSLTALSAFQIGEILRGKTRKLRIGNYVLTDRLGAGGMGEVFKGWNLNLDRMEAIKTITSDEVTGSTIGLARFEREARVLAQLHHPCITTIYFTGREAGVAYIAMEYVRGRTLLQVVKDAQSQGEMVPVEWAIDAMKEVASALEHAHNAGIIHRDIKPNNIMITEEGEVRVLDLGIARLREPEKARAATNLTRHVAGMGTPEVMPPEQWADASSVSPASDIYSLGCTFFFLLCGRMPYEESDLQSLMHAHLTEPIPDAHAVRKDVPPVVARIISKTMEKNPPDRFASCRELIDALESQTVEQTTSRKVVRQEKRRRGGTWAWISAAALILAILGAGVGVLLNQDRTDYAAKADEFLSVFQQKNFEVWPSPASLRTAVNASPVANVSSKNDLADLEAWVQNETEHRRTVRDEFMQWLRQQSAENTTVWPSDDAVTNFLEADLQSVSQPADYDLLRSKLKEETARRVSLQQQSHATLNQWATDHSAVWPKRDELDEHAESAVPLASITTESHLATRIDAVRTETKRRWGDRLAKQLEQIQGQNVDAWQTLDLLKEFASQIKPLDSVDSPAAFQEIIDKVDKRTWERRSLDWVISYRREHPLVWMTDTDVMKVVQETIGGNVESESSFQSMQAAVREQTRERGSGLVSKWSDEYVQLHPTVWRDGRELAESFSEIDQEDFSRPNGKEIYLKVADLLSFQRGFDAPPPTPDELSAEEQESLKDNSAALERYMAIKTFQEKYLLRLLVWLLGLPSAPAEEPAKVELVVDVDGKDVSSIPLGQYATFTVRSSVPGYLTIIVLEASGKVFAFQWDAPLVAGEPTPVLRLDAVEKGVDRMVLFVTDQSPWQQIPPPPPGLKIQPKPVPREGYLQQRVDPPISLQQAAIKRLAKAMSSPSLFQEILDRIRDGKPLPHVPTNQEVKVWGRLSTPVRWGE